MERELAIIDTTRLLLTPALSDLKDEIFTSTHASVY